MLSIALALAAATASLGLAAQPPGKGPSCTRFDLQGPLLSVARSSFSMSVTKGRAKGSRVITVALTPDTESFWTGRGTLAGPTAGEWAWAKGKLCDGAYTATWVLIRPRR